MQLHFLGAGIVAGLSNDRNVVCVVPKEELRTTANAIVHGIKTQEPVPSNEGSDSDQGETSNKED